MLQLFFRTVEVDRRNIVFTLVPTLFPWLCNILAETYNPQNEAFRLSITNRIIS